jgi:hypothetical protein
VAQRFTAAINGLFSATAFAAEGDCGARREFFTKRLLAEKLDFRIRASL